MINATHLIATGLAIFLSVYAPSSVAETKLSGQVVSIDADFGNLNTDILASQVTVDLGRSFRFTCKERSITAVYSGDYSDVSEGGWLGLENPNGNLQIAINYGDANTSLNCNVGDKVFVTFD